MNAWNSDQQSDRLRNRLNSGDKQCTELVGDGGATHSNAGLSRRSVLKGTALFAGTAPLFGLAACFPPPQSLANGQGPFGSQPGIGGPSGFATPASNAGAFVNMTDQLRFDPQVVTIQRGQTVVWRNVSRHVHTVTFDPRLARDRRNVILPQGVAPFSTDNIPPGASVSHRFTAPGEYRYFCIPHEQQNMLGAVRVFV
jgi:plastocyanin